MPEREISNAERPRMEVPGRFEVRVGDIAFVRVELALDHLNEVPGITPYVVTNVDGKGSRVEVAPVLAASASTDPWELRIPESEREFLGASQGVSIDEIYIDTRSGVQWERGRLWKAHRQGLIDRMAPDTTPEQRDKFLRKEFKALKHRTRPSHNWRLVPCNPTISRPTLPYLPPQPNEE